MYNQKVITHSGATCFRGTLTTCAKWIARTKGTKQFNAGRKFAKTHQNILVFCKGDWRKATKAANL